MNRIQFSVLSYYPSDITNENVNVGILFYNLDTNERFFRTISKWNRLESFDTAIDLDYVKNYLQGIRNETEYSLFNATNDFDLHEYVTFFKGKLQFNEIQETVVRDVNTFIGVTEKIHMRLDFDGKDRLSQNNEIQFTKMMMRSNHISFTAEPIRGRFNEEVHYDFMVGMYGFKFFSFDEKRMKSIIPAAKSWSYTAQELGDEIKTIFVYDIEAQESENYQILIRILKENSYKVMKNSEVMDFAIRIQRENDKQYQPELMLS